MREPGSPEETTSSAPVSRREFVRAAGVSATGLALAGLIAPADAASPTQVGGLTKVFIRGVKRARLFDLSHVWDENSPIASVNPPYTMALNANHGLFDPVTNPSGTRDTFGDGGQLSFTSEIQQWSGQHGAPNLDALGHIGHDGLLFGGVDAAAATSNPLGLGRSGVGEHLDVAHYPTDLLVNRGVLLDVARLVQGDLSPLPPGFEITDQHLADTAAAQGVSLEPGDTVLIRTGWGQHFAGNPALYAGPASPGPGVGGAQFLIDRGARVVGNDTLTFEKRPPIVFTPAFQVFPVHMLLIADHGVFIIENFDLEGLAAAGVHEFLLVVPPLKIRGGTGSALRAFALAP